MIQALYRPVGPKRVQLGNPWTSGGSLNLTGQVDLSLPIRGLRFVFRGRWTLGGADMASVTPEGLLNLIPRILVQGTNSRQGGNITFCDMDLATLYGIQAMFNERPSQYTVNGTTVGQPGTPYPPSIIVTQGAYDFRIVVDVPFHPFPLVPGIVPAFLVRKEEWKESIQITLDYATVANGAVNGPLGLGQAATTHVFSQFGGAGGTPVVDIYALPIEMGDLRNLVQPGVLVRTVTPLTTIFQSAQGPNASLLDLQLKKTPRIYLKIGTSVSGVAFATLSDTNLTAWGLSVGGNRDVRDEFDIFSHKQEQSAHYGRNPIQGYNAFDFIQSGNPDSAYPGDEVSSGVKLQLVGTCAGIANARAHVIQEQILYRPEGVLYNPV